MKLLGLPHSQAFQESDGGQVPGIRDTDDPLGPRVVEDQADALANGFPGQTLSLRLAAERKADLGFAAVIGQAEADVADQPVTLLVGDPDLAPRAGLQKFCRFHLGQEGPGLWIRDGFPSLVTRHLCVPAVSLKVRKVSRTESPQDDAFCRAGKEIDRHDHAAREFPMDRVKKAAYFLRGPGPGSSPYTNKSDLSGSMVICEDDVQGAEVIALLEAHLDTMALHSPPESRHALDLDGLRAPDVTFWTVWEEARLLGCGALKELSETHGEIKSMHTAQAARGRGVARRLVAHIIAEARRRAYRRLSLETGSMAAFAPAQALYDGFGFCYCEPFAGYRHDPNSVFMTLELA